MEKKLSELECNQPTITTSKTTDSTKTETFFTIQHKDAFEHARKVGYLEGNPEFICHYDFESAYQWMMEQMRSRLPNYKGERPVWLWKNKPFNFQEQLETGECVCLELELNPENVLLSHFDGWHCVLNGWFLPLTEEEDDEFDTIRPLKATRDIIEKSWQRIFDVELLNNSEVWGDGIDSAPYPAQGTTGRIELNSIVSVIHHRKFNKPTQYAVRREEVRPKEVSGTGKKPE